jgi:hypothetical protein
MDKKLKAKWIKALRSGEYKQGKGVLRSGTGKDASYCCLGVLCDVAGKRVQEGQLYPTLKHQIEFGLYDKTELKHDLHLYDDSSVAVRLSEWNDGNHIPKPKSFKWIATWIEKNL